MSDAILRDHEERLKRLEERFEELRPPKRPKPEPQGLHIDAKAVRASMAEKGWNQSDLARMLGVGKDRVSVWLSGKTVRPEHWALLCQCVDVV